MSTLSWIVLTSLVGGLLSVLGAAAITRLIKPASVSILISYAIGALLGAVFLEILPHALEHASDVHSMAATILFGILGFFVLEKLVLWQIGRASCRGRV